MCTIQSLCEQDSMHCVIVNLGLEAEVGLDKWKRNKTLRLIKKAFGGKDGTSTNKGTKKRS